MIMRNQSTSNVLAHLIPFQIKIKCDTQLRQEQYKQQREILEWDRKKNMGSFLSAMIIQCQSQRQKQTDVQLNYSPTLTAFLLEAECCRHQ